MTDGRFDAMERAHCGLFSLWPRIISTLSALPTRKSTCSFHVLVTRAVVLFRAVWKNSVPIIRRLSDSIWILRAYYSTQCQIIIVIIMKRNHTKHDQINGTCAIAANNRSWPLIWTQTEHRLMMSKWKNEQNYTQIGRESTRKKNTHEWQTANRQWV